MNKLPFIVFLFCMIGCSDLVQRHEQSVIAKINSQPVYLADVKIFYRHLKSDRSQTEEMTDPVLIDRLRHRALNEAIISTLVRREANNENIQVAKEEVEGRLANWKEAYPSGGFEEMLRKTGTTEVYLKRKITTQILIEKITNELFASETLVSDDEINQYYNKHKKDFVRPSRVHALQILVPTKEEAEKILTQINEDQLAFESAARKYSLSPDAARGGDLGFFSADEKIPGFNKAFALKVGEVSKPIQTQYGFHLLKIVEKQRKKQLQVNEARSDISSQLKHQKERRIYKEWVTKLLKEGKIYRNETLFARLD